MEGNRLLGHLECVLLADTGQRANKLGDRPECDAVAERETNPLRDARPVSETGNELGGEARLPDAGLPDDRHKPCSPGKSRIEFGLEERELVSAADEAVPRGPSH